MEPDIAVAVDAPAIEAVRELWREYWTALGLDAHFRGFATELESLPGVYRPPSGLLLVCWCDGAAAGTAAMRPLSNEACEAKRLYVRPAFRGRGVARRLLEKLMADARQIGYQTMDGDSLPSMTGAINLYRSVGFKEVRSYSDKPTPGAIYIARGL